jgi:hypothetical protein
MGWYRVLAPLLVAVAVTACADGTPGTASGLVRTRGVIVRVGGPAPGGSATGRADRHGRFALLLEPGTYRITITGHAPESDGRPMQPVPNVIHVGRSGARVRLVVSIR